MKIALSLMALIFTFSSHAAVLDCSIDIYSDGKIIEQHDVKKEVGQSNASKFIKTKNGRYLFEIHGSKAVQNSEANDPFKLTIHVTDLETNIINSNTGWFFDNKSVYRFESFSVNGPEQGYMGTCSIR